MASTSITKLPFQTGRKTVSYAQLSPQGYAQAQAIRVQGLQGYNNTLATSGADLKNAGVDRVRSRQKLGFDTNAASEEAGASLANSGLARTLGGARATALRDLTQTARDAGAAVETGYARTKAGILLAQSQALQQYKQAQAEALGLEARDRASLANYIKGVQ